MTSANPFLHLPDPEVRRRRALAQVYEFLLQLAEQAESQRQDLSSHQEQESDLAPLQENIPS